MAVSSENEGQATFTVISKPTVDGAVIEAAVSRESGLTLEDAKKAVSRAYAPFDSVRGQNGMMRFLDGTPDHIELFRTTGWRKISEDGGSALLPNNTVIEVVPDER